MFVRNLGGKFSFFRMQAIYNDRSGALRTVEFAKLAATPTFTGDPVPVALWFVGMSGVSRVDDVYVDPWSWG